MSKRTERRKLSSFEMQIFVSNPLEISHQKARKSKNEPQEKARMSHIQEIKMNSRAFGKSRAKPFKPRRENKKKRKEKKRKEKKEKGKKRKEKKRKKRVKKVSKEGGRKNSVWSMSKLENVRRKSGDRLSLLWFWTA